MKQEQPDRYLKLEKILGRGSFESRDVITISLNFHLTSIKYPGGLTKEKRRVQIAQGVASLFHHVYSHFQHLQMKQ